MTTFFQEGLPSLLSVPSSFGVEETAEDDLSFEWHGPRRFRTAAEDPKGSDGNPVLETAAAKVSGDAPVASSPGLEKRDPRGIGLIDEIGGDGNGWMSCTESLGFESSDERRVDGQIDRDDIPMISSGRLGSDDNRGGYHRRRSAKEENCPRWRKVGDENRETETFPPPLSTLNINGQPSFFLLPLRKDGRLELREVRIPRSEILRASRQDGRLRIHLLRDPHADEAEEEEVTHETGVEGESEEEQEIEKEAEAREARNPEKEGVSLGLTRCHELVNRYPHPSHTLHHPCRSTPHPFRVVTTG